MRLGGRLERAERAVRDRPRTDQFSLVQAVPVGRAGGLPLGLHADGPRGSTAGVLVYNPAVGRPEVPEGRLAPWGLLIVCEAEFVDGPL
ncbi:unnamed protein product [Gemmataceae bacterium]|nr:unnamed protein product [Gemmataceae bacterium]VTU02525.1 unnamed protein product [Gemmataceae bacterium]